MKVLSGPKSVLFHTFLLKKTAKIGRIPIPYVILNVLFASPMVMNVVLMSYRIFVEFMNGGGFMEMSGSFYISLGTISAVLIYSSLALNYKLLIILLDLIEKVVYKRKKTH